MKQLTKEQVNKYFKFLEAYEDDFFDNIKILEAQMQKETGIEDIEFFFVEGHIVGIGNASRTISLIHRES